jgi:hypothetical protein
MLKTLMSVLVGLVVSISLSAGAEKPPVREAIEVEITGRLSYRSDHLEKAAVAGIWEGPIRFARQGHFVTASGREFMLDFDGNKHLSGLANDLRGKEVVVKGSLEIKTFVTGCLGYEANVFVVHVRDLKAVEK